MIVKVQVSLASSDNEDHMLIYNEDRSLWYEGTLTASVKEAMGKDLKAYFVAHLINGELELSDKVPKQDF